MNKLGLVWRTVRYLTWRQLVFQVVVRLRSRPTLRLPAHVPVTHHLAVPEASKLTTYYAGRFTFLNQSYAPEAGIVDWNGEDTSMANYGKLWLYHLNYFAFLNQPEITPEEGMRLIHAFISETHRLRDGLEPYPTSIRVINWIQFLNRYQIQHEAINGHLAAQVDLVSRRLEYHLGGNHLLENGFALLMGALYYQNKSWFRKAAALVQAELQTQILPDGGHNERSPVYHQLLLDQLLTVVKALQHDEWHRSMHQELVDYLTAKAYHMLAWLNTVTFSNGDVPMVNDSAFGFAPTTAQLNKKAADILPPLPEGVAWVGVRETNKLLPTGYRMFRFDRYELVADVGPVGADEQPGHAHADTFSFVLYTDGVPLLVDSGTSTYEPGARRAWERSTSAHNTVEVSGLNSSEVWANFRVGRRARVRVLNDTPESLIAWHDGYRQQGIIHERAWLLTPASLTITDRLFARRTSDKPMLKGVARFHVYPGTDVQLTGEIVRLGAWQLYFRADSKPTVSVESYSLADGFNRLQTSLCIHVTFTEQLQTTLTLIE